MTIQWNKWRIKSTEFGYTVERKLNPTRWKVESYHNTLAQAYQSLLDYRIRSETTEYVIDAMNAASARVSTAKLIEMINFIADEMIVGIDG